MCLYSSLSIFCVIKYHINLCVLDIHSLIYLCMFLLFIIHIIHVCMYSGLEQYNIIYVLIIIKIVARRLTSMNVYVILIIYYSFCLLFFIRI